MNLYERPWLTENNYFQYGRIQGHPSVFFSKLDAFPSSTDNSDTGLSAAIVAARKIKEQADAQRSFLNLCISGGIDSEVMLLSFLAADVEFEATVLRFKNGFNDFDISNIIEFCDQRKIKLTILELDVLEFLESGKHVFYGEKYQCQSPQLAVHLWMLDQIEGFPVLAGNFIYPQHTESGIFYVGLPGDLHCVYFRYFEISKRPGVPWFLIYTPNLTYAFFKTSLMQKQLQSNLYSQVLFSYSVKCEIYRQAGFDVHPRLDKFTGFERVRDYYDQKFQTSFGLKFNELFRSPLEKINPLPKEYLQLVSISDSRTSIQP